MEVEVQIFQPIHHDVSNSDRTVVKRLQILFYEPILPPAAQLSHPSMIFYLCHRDASVSRNTIFGSLT